MGTELIIKNVDITIPDILIRDIDEKTYSNEEDLQRIKEQILILSAMTPRTVVLDNEEISWEDYIASRVSSLLDEYYSYSVNSYILEVAKENRDKLKESF